MAMLHAMENVGIDGRTKKIMAEKLGMDAFSISNNASFINDLGIDSLDLLEIIMEWEKEFHITIPDEDKEKLVNIEAVIKYIANKH
jgi:acyl carrier protein